MPRVSGIDIPPDKPIWVSPGYIYGIGPHNSRVILKQLNIDPQRRAKELTEEELAQKEQVLVALRLVSVKLNLAQRKAQGLPPVNTIRNHKIG